MFGKTHSEKARNNISTKRKEKFASGEYTFIDSEKWSNAAKKVWEREDYRENMQLARENSGWKKKISIKMKGKNHPFYGKTRPEHSKLMKTPEMLEKIFAKRSLTNIEQLMMEILDQLKIDYYSQFFITHGSNTYAYDFKLKNIPILIEVDGDYWHGGPSVDKHVSHLNEVQQNGVVKNKIALEHGYTLLRFWGSDITERPFWVTQQLLTKINQPI